MSQSEETQYALFISYRRDDTAMAAGRIDDFLAVHFNKAKIFRDVREIGLGNQFPERLQKALAQSKVLLVVIGEKWLTIADSAGRRRIDNPSDWVRVEISTTVQSGKAIIPLLIENAKMPLNEDLPEDLQNIVNWQALRIRADTFAYDMLFLVKYLETIEHLEPNQEHPHINEISELAIEDFREHLFDTDHKEDVAWIKDVLRDEMYKEFEREQYAEQNEDQWREDNYFRKKGDA